MEQLEAPAAPPPVRASGLFNIAAEHTPNHRRRVVAGVVGYWIE